jgi:hypothetical protein
MTPLHSITADVQVQLATGLSAQAATELPTSQATAKPDFSRKIPDFSPNFFFGLKFRAKGFGFWVFGFFIRV